MSARNKRKAVYWSTSAQSSKMFDYFFAGRKTATRSVTRWLMQPFKPCCNMLFVSLLSCLFICQAVHKYKSSKLQGWAYQWSYYIFLGTSNDWQLKMLLCYTIGFNFNKNPVMLVIYWFYCWFSRLLTCLSFVVLRY